MLLLGGESEGLDVNVESGDGFKKSEESLYLLNRRDLSLFIVQD